MTSTTATDTTDATFVIKDATECAEEMDCDLKIIHMVKQLKILYSTDNLDRHYQSNISDQREKAWTVVANEIGMSGKYNFCFSTFFIFLFL